MFTENVWGARWVLALALALGLVACGGDEQGDDPKEISSLEATLGPGGGKVEGLANTLFEGFVLDVPPGALPENTSLLIRETNDEPDLPDGAHSVGTVFRLEASAPLGQEATLQIPYSEQRVVRVGAEATEVKVWLRDPNDGWTLIEPSSRGQGTITIPISHFTAVGAGVQF